MLPGGKWHVHDGRSPHPPIVTPGAFVSEQPPSDAIVLFDGNDLSKWQSVKGGAARWSVEDGYFVVAPGTGDIETKEKFGAVQSHLEWSEPTPPRSSSQGRGNSGVFLQGQYGKCAGITPITMGTLVVVDVEGSGGNKIKSEIAVAGHRSERDNVRAEGEVSGGLTWRPVEERCGDSVEVDYVAGSLSGLPAVGISCATANLQKAEARENVALHAVRAVEFFRLKS
jgi:hypothetical protein